MSEKNCGTCAHFKVYGRVLGYDIGTCFAPLPICVAGVDEERMSTYDKNGTTCQCWKERE